VARVLLDEIAALIGVEFVGLALVDGNMNGARPAGTARGRGFDYWSRFDLRGEPSASRRTFDVAPVTVYDTASSSLIQPVAGRSRRQRTSSARLRRW
jgi:hypothetical protein